MNSDFAIQRGYLVAYHGHDTHVTVPVGVTCIGHRSFYGCAISHINLPDTVTEIEQEAFALSDLEQIELGRSVQKVGKDAFPSRESIYDSIFKVIPIRCFSKANQECAFRYFLNNYDRLESEIQKSNLKFIGKNMFRADLSSMWCDELVCNRALFNKVIECSAIPRKDIDPLLEHFADSDLAVQLLEYKNARFKNTDKKCATEQAVDRIDWRKKYRFRYRDGCIEITRCMDCSDNISVPREIGDGTVRYIGSRAFDGHYLPDNETFEKQLDNKRSIVFPDGILEFKSYALYCINNRDVYIPETVTELPSGFLVAVDNIVLHIPSSVTTIPDDLVWDSPNGAISIQTPTDSFAQKYAIRNGIALNKSLK